MLFVGYCLLRAVRYLLFVDCVCFLCVLLVVCCSLFDARCLLFVAFCLLLIVVVCCGAGCLMLSCLLSVVCFFGCL